MKFFLLFTSIYFSFVSSSHPAIASDPQNLLASKATLLNSGEALEHLHENLKAADNITCETETGTINITRLIGNDSSIRIEQERHNDRIKVQISSFDNRQFEFNTLVVTDLAPSSPNNFFKMNQLESTRSENVAIFDYIPEAETSKIPQTIILQNLAHDLTLDAFHCFQRLGRHQKSTLFN